MGTVALAGPWQFHIGDDMRWAQPGINDSAGMSGWETILPDRPWGAQDHFAATGYGWYRLHLHVTPAAGFHGPFQLLIPRVSDVCEVYWNGRLIGAVGKLPPHPWTPAVNAPEAFTLAGEPVGTLAIRVWTAPMGSSSSGVVGGLVSAPLIGDPQSIAGQIAEWDDGFLTGTLYTNVLNALYFVIAMAAFAIWARRRDESFLLWFAIFAACPPLWQSPIVMRMPVSAQVIECLIQPLFQLRNVALWFLLIDMLRLRERPVLVRWARTLAILSMVAASLDGCLTFVGPDYLSEATGAWIDAVFTVIATGCEAYLLVLIAVGVRQKLDSLRWVIALSAFTAQLIMIVLAASQQGQRFTHWTLVQTLSAPLFHLGSVSFNAQTIADTLLFFSILYAVYRYLQDQQRRKATLEQELQSARELQEVLIPEKLPVLPGFTISSAYHPALEVGGDFFQIIPLEGEGSGSTLIVLGDVSGKGLRAAMAVSLILGAVRTLAETTSSPAEILAGISRRLHGRLQGGFTTCLALRLEPDGVCSVASAGHPPPYLNDTEIGMPGALPLGIDPSTVYEEVTLQIAPGDHCALYTDGLLEARAASGEIFSFARLQALFASRADAATASDAAVRFGQEDDITVLTLTRTASA